MLGNPQAIRTKKIDHLGLVAGICHRLGVAERIDELLENDPRKKISHGTAVTAMILNGLGFINRRLYLVSQFFEKKPLERLLQADVEPSQLNDDALGRSLDAIASYGTTRLFCELAFQIGSEFQLLGKTVHLDTTSFSLEGDYESAPGAEDDKCLKVLRGHSKDHRPDLKQVVLSLCTTGPASLPLRMESLDGNSSDHKSFHDTIASMKELQQQFQWPERLLWVADSALYHKKKLALADGFDWVTRVPETVKLEKAVCSTEPEGGWQEIPDSPDLKYWSTEVESLGVLQRWVIVESSQYRERKQKTFCRGIDKQVESAGKALKMLSAKTFKCEPDARMALNDLMAKFPMLKVEKIVVDERWQHPAIGRPKVDSEKILTGVRLEVSASRNQQAIEKANIALGRFVLGTNLLDRAVLPDIELIKTYKDQQDIERGFRFLKDSRFLVSQVFLKSPSRIDALMMVMSLTLMVYNIGQYWLREELAKRKETIPNQVGKQVQNPTLRWVFELMDGIDAAWITFGTQVMEATLNLDELQTRIAGYFGSATMKIYGIPEKGS